MVRWLVSDVVRSQVVLWFGPIDELVSHGSDVIEELVNGLLKFLKKDGNIRESQSEWVDTIVLVVLDCILDLSVESFVLDVLSLDRLVPFVVEAAHGGRDLADVVENSSELSHNLKIGVAGVIASCLFIEIKKFTKDIEQVIEESLFHVFHENALSWVLEAPILGVILHSLEVANFGIFVVQVNERACSILYFVDADRPEVLMNFSRETPDGVESGLHPMTKTVIRHNMLILGIPSFNETSVGILQEDSIRLHMV